MKRPPAPAPLAGAAKVTRASGTGFLSVSVTVTARGMGNTVPAGVDWVEPTPGAIFAGLPARFTREKLTGATPGAPELLAFSAPPPAPPPPPPPSLEIEAVAVNEPVALVAVNVGEAAIPRAPLVAVAWVPPPAKVALAAAPAPQRPALPVPSANVTAAPATGLPLASTTRTCRGRGKWLATLVDSRLGGIARSRAGRPAAVLVRENDTEP